MNSLNLKSHSTKILISLYQYRRIIVFCIATFILTSTSGISLTQKTKLIRLGTGTHRHEYFLKGMELVKKLNQVFDEGKKIDMAILPSNIYEHARNSLKDRLEPLGDLYDEKIFMVYRKGEYTNNNPEAFKKKFRNSRICLGQSLDYHMVKETISSYNSNQKEWWAEIIFHQLNSRFNLNCQFNPSIHQISNPPYDPFKSLQPCMP